MRWYIACLPTACLLLTLQVSAQDYSDMEMDDQGSYGTSDDLPVVNLPIVNLPANKTISRVTVLDLADKTTKKPNVTVATTRSRRGEGTTKAATTRKATTTAATTVVTDWPVTTTEATVTDLVATESAVDNEAVDTTTADGATTGSSVPSTTSMESATTGLAATVTEETDVDTTTAGDATTDSSVATTTSMESTVTDLAATVTEAAVDSETTEAAVDSETTDTSAATTLEVSPSTGATDNIVTDDTATADSSSTTDSSAATESTTLESAATSTSVDNEAIDTSRQASTPSSPDNSSSTTSEPSTTTRSTRNSTDASTVAGNVTSTSIDAASSAALTPVIPLPAGTVIPIWPGTSALLVLLNGTVIATGQGWPLMLPNGTKFPADNSQLDLSLNLSNLTNVIAIPIAGFGALIPIRPGTTSITILPGGSALQTSQTWFTLSPLAGTAQTSPTRGQAASAAAPAPVMVGSPSSSQGWGKKVVVPAAAVVPQTSSGWGQQAVAQPTVLVAAQPASGWGSSQQTGGATLGSGLGSYGGYGSGLIGLGTSLASYGSLLGAQAGGFTGSSGYGGSAAVPVSGSGWSSGSVTRTVAAPVEVAPVVTSQSGWGSSAKTPVVLVAQAQQPSGWGSSGGHLVASVLSGQSGYGGLGGTGAQLHSPIWQPFQAGMNLGVGMLGLRSANLSEILAKKNDTRTGEGVATVRTSKIRGSEAEKPPVLVADGKGNHRVIVERLPPHQVGQYMDMMQAAMGPLSEMMDSFPMGIDDESAPPRPVISAQKRCRKDCDNFSSRQARDSCLRDCVGQPPQAADEEW